MIQRRFIIGTAIIFMLLSAAACDRAPETAPRATDGRGATVASLSPAATDLIVAMGLEDRLVAVSNYEPPRPATDSLPRVGDYRTADWEKIAQLQPSIIITQYRPDKMPEGFSNRAAGLKIRVFNRKIDSLDDAFNALAELGTLLEAPDAAAVAQDRWRREMDRVRESVASKPPTPTLLIVGDGGVNAVGPNTFLGDLLKIAGGKNVITDGSDYPTLDREKLASLDPAVVIQLLPAASPQAIRQADEFWRAMPELRAVRTGQVHRLEDVDVLLPGFNVTRTAARFARILHGPAAGPAATTQTAETRPN